MSGLITINRNVQVDPEQVASTHVIRAGSDDGWLEVTMHDGQKFTTDLKSAGGPDPCEVAKWIRSGSWRHPERFGNRKPDWAA